MNAFEYRQGLTEAKYGQMAANLFVEKNQKDTMEGRVIGAVTNGILTAITGTITVYLLSATGRDKAPIKGMGVGLLFWLTLFGLTPKAGVVQKNQKPLTSLLSLADHIIFGTLCGIIASKLGDDSLFPDSKSSGHKRKVPLFSYSQEQDYSQGQEEDFKNPAKVSKQTRQSSIPSKRTPTK
ncbi:MAG TPA: hypothetical protein GX697_05780 [Firmicutes bacterium]|nr:hypothetical protein [Bacillota bacterium]